MGMVIDMRLIDADALLEDVRKNSESYFADDFAKYWVDKQPTIEPERNYDEWCLDCKEYDHDRHCCPRFNRVIGSVMDEIKTDRKLEKIMKGKHDD